MSDETAKSCLICSSGPQKYRCPTCGIRYCGVPCFSKHKENCRPATKTSSEDVYGPPSGSALAAASASPSVDDAAAAALSTAAAAAGSALAAGLGGDDADFNLALSDAQLLRMSTDSKLLATLRDRRLQEVIRAVDSAADRPAALKRARERWGADFQAFLDDMLVTVGVAVRRPDGSVEFTGSDR